MQIVGGLIDDNTLLEIEVGVEEATAWMEAEAHLNGIVSRYEKAERLLSDTLDSTRTAERETCTCFRP
ncbi:MAG: hypothetical protein Kow0013_02050 [Pararhodobacter sp.]